jgi:hypothetical protein
MQKDATPGAVREILFVHGAGALNAYWELELPSSTAIWRSQGPVIQQPVGGDRWLCSNRGCSA